MTHENCLVPLFARLVVQGVKQRTGLRMHVRVELVKSALDQFTGLVLNDQDVLGSVRCDEPPGTSTLDKRAGE